MCEEHGERRKSGKERDGGKKKKKTGKEYNYNGSRKKRAIGLHKQGIQEDNASGEKTMGSGCNPDEQDRKHMIQWTQREDKHIAIQSAICLASIATGRTSPTGVIMGLTYGSGAVMDAVAKLKSTSYTREQRGLKKRKRRHRSDAVDPIPSSCDTIQKEKRRHKSDAVNAIVTMPVHHIIPPKQARASLAHLTTTCHISLLDALSFSTQKSINFSVSHFPLICY